MEIGWTKRLKLPNEMAFQEFVQRMANRLAFGYVRYGKPDRRKKYMTRLGLEFNAYKRTGNAEHLYNIANYAHLESFAPENSKFHYDDRVESVTRGKV